MSSKLLRGGIVPSDPVAWPRVDAQDAPPVQKSYPAASYGPMGDSSIVGQAPQHAG